jgi:hypothetical protein
MDPKDRISAADLTAELQKLPRKAFSAIVPQAASTGLSTSVDPDFVQLSAPRSPLPLPSTSQSELPSTIPSGPQPSADRASVDAVGTAAFDSLSETNPALDDSASVPRPSAVVHCAPATLLPQLSHDGSTMSPTQALATFQSVFNDHTAAAVAYRDDIEFAVQLCSDFAAEEGKNYDISRPLHEASTLLKKVLASRAFPIDYKAQISFALPEAVAVVKNSGFRDELIRSDALQVRILEEKEEQALRERDIPQAEQHRHHILQFQSSAAQRLKDCDESAAALSKLTSAAEQLLARQPRWPRHGALVRFEAKLERLTSHMFLTKKWVPRFFVLRGSRLYYSNGKEGYPDSLEGSLAYMKTNPSPNGHFCMNIQGAQESV